MVEIRLMRFCPMCAARLDEIVREDKARPECPRCGFRQHANPVPAVNGVVVSEGHLLLIRRGHAPFEGQWALPGGFVDWDEEAAEAAMREVLEETGIEAEITGSPVILIERHDPRGNTLNTNYPARPVGGGLPVATGGDDAEDARWWPLGEMPPLAFTTHVESVRILIERDSL